MTLWEAGQQGIHQVADDSSLLCYNDFGAGGLSDSIDLNGWTTQEANKVVIKPAVGSEHGGKRRSDGGTGFKITAASGTTIRVSSVWARIEGIEIEQTGGTSSSHCMKAFAPSSYTEVDSCIFNGTGGGSSSGIYQQDINYKMRLTNSLVYHTFRGVDWRTRGPGSAIESWIHNCTLITNSSDNALLLVTQNVDIKNVVAINEGAGDAFGYASDGAGSVYENLASHDTSAKSTSGPAALHNVSTADGVNFVSPSTNDYSPQSGGVLDGAGQDLSLEFTNDILGAARSVPWEIGAYEIVAAGGVTFDGPNIIDQPQGVENEVFVFDENGEGTVASRFSVT
jgi:hypothetical protein